MVFNDTDIVQLLHCPLLLILGLTVFPVNHTHAKILKVLKMPIYHFLIHIKVHVKNNYVLLSKLLRKFTHSHRVKIQTRRHLSLICTSGKNAHPDLKD